jgi:hypothetical protein
MERGSGNEEDATQTLRVQGCSVNKFGSSPKELLMHKLILFAPKRKPQAFFYLSPFVPPLHEMERGSP